MKAEREKEVIEGGNRRTNRNERTNCQVRRFERLGAQATGAVFPGLCARRHVDRRSDTRARTRAQFVPRSCHGATGTDARIGVVHDPRRRSLPRTRPAGPASAGSLREISTGTRRPSARGAGPPEGLLDARKDAARTRATAGGGHLALQSQRRPQQSSQWSSVHGSSGCPLRNPTLPLWLARAHTGRPRTHPRHIRSHRPRVAPCIISLTGRPNPRENRRRTGSRVVVVRERSVRVCLLLLSLSRAQCPTDLRGVST